MKTTIRARSLAGAMALAISTGVVADTGLVDPLRGGVDLDAEAPAPAIANPRKDGLPIPRNYVQQPPVIPHKIRGYQVDLRVNKCLDCHSWENYRQYGATKVSLTHFETRDGHALSEISPRRYFCLQCHVPQAEVEPLVDNAYKSTSELRDQ